MLSGAPATLIELLEREAETRPQEVIYSFLSESEEWNETLNVRELQVRAKALAAALQSCGLAGERALVICNRGLEWMVGLFGCFYAGVIAVPVPPSGRQELDLRTRAIADDSGARVVLAANEHQLRLLQKNFPGTFRHFGFEIAECSARNWICPGITPESLALLQYTSGSTGVPKGVMVSHRNILANAAQIHAAFGLTSDDRCLLWLPPYHDMGLMGGVIQPIYSGHSTRFVSPSSFMSRPLQWLELISEHLITVSGGPNFAFDLCARLSSRLSTHINLTSWRIAFNGAEVVRNETMRAFADAFRPHGFRPSAFRPCYGLAEATLLVSVSELSSEPTLTVDSEALGYGKLVAPGERQGKSLDLVSIGSAGPGQLVAVVDPVQGTVCHENEVGEIWISGPNVAQGYWRRSEENAAVFHARLKSNEERTYLRTGDLGVVRDGRLFVTGRIKEMIIIRGRNYYPHDIEAAVEASHPMLVRGCAAAFAIDVGGEERLAVVQEVSRAGLKGDFSAALDAIRRRIFEQHQLSPYSVVLIRPGTLPKTRSGKIRRNDCRAAYLEGKLAVLAESKLGRAESSALNFKVDQGRQAKSLDMVLAQYLSSDGQAPDLDLTIAAMGLDSIAMLEFKMAIEQATGAEIAISQLMHQATVGTLLEAISDAADRRSTSHISLAEVSSQEFPLSAGQRALWYLQQLEPDNTSLNIARSLRIQGPLNRTALRDAFDVLVARHPSLRMKVRVSDGRPCQFASTSEGALFSEHEARAWSESDLTSHARQQARKAFDLENDPVLRLDLYIRSDSEAVLLVCAHHIAVDLWSFALMIEEFFGLLEEFRSGGTPSLQTEGSRYSDYVSWQESMLVGAEGERLWAYWRRHLQGSVAPLELAFGRNAVAPRDSRTRFFELSEQLFFQVKQLARKHQVSLYTLLLAAFELLLSRYSGEEEFLIGVLSAGRSHARWANIVGYFVNPIVFHAHSDPQLTFIQHLNRCRRELLENIDHADLPFPVLVEKLHSRRVGHNAPLVQVMCMLQPSLQRCGTDLSPLAMGRAGTAFNVGDLRFESMDNDFDQAQFDLVFAAAESGTRILAAFQFDSARFDERIISGMASDFCALLGEVVAEPSRKLGLTPIFDDQRKYEVLSLGNATEWNHIPEISIHAAFELQAAKTPSKPAVVFEATELSFVELNAKANQLSHFLKELGVGIETRVAFCMERSQELVVAILGILKASAAYVPIDPSCPSERLNQILDNSAVQVLLISYSLKTRVRENSRVRIVCWEEAAETIACGYESDLPSEVEPENLAYIMHTSGSTGNPKGVMISHQNVMNFFAGMDKSIGCGPSDVLLAVTSVAFDISVLELLWTLSRGCKVVIAGELGTANVCRSWPRARPTRPLKASLFYFASGASNSDGRGHRLLFEGAKLADRLGFEAVWTPERHFHPFGGLYPNPSVTSAALAGITTRIHLRAGSIVLPLHNPVRVAEEWALVDNLSNGRVGVAFASGWHADDFVFAPEQYADRREMTLSGVDTVRRLWRGESIQLKGGAGNWVDVRTYPLPVQRELPVWLTSGGTPETFIAAGRIGAGVLTHLLGQELKDVAERIELYRKAREDSGKDLSGGGVTLMLHSYIGSTMKSVRDTAFEPFKHYLNSSVGLIANLVRSLNLDLDLGQMAQKDRDDLLSFAAERYFSSSGLLGTESVCLELLEALSAMGVDEIACLIDFGIDAASVLESIGRIHKVVQRLNQECSPPADYSPAAQATRHRVTMMQATPSLLRMMLPDLRMQQALGAMRLLLVGGEPVPSTVVRDAAQAGVPRIFNMYGPTESTVWSAVLDLDPSEQEVLIGGPIANTTIYILDQELMLVPPGVLGEIYIGGAGLARGYAEAAALTAERFIPDPFSQVPGRRLYRTGDLGRWRPGGEIEMQGRTDHQVKIRGHRVELGDIEASLNLAPGVKAGVAFKSVGSGEDSIVAVLVPEAEQSGLDTLRVRDFLSARLPHYMVPSIFHVVPVLPLSSNGKVDRRALKSMNLPRKYSKSAGAVPRSGLESQIATIWREILGLESVSVDDNFFDIGGHSLLMVQVHHKLQKLLQRNFPLLAMLNHPTIRAIAEHLEGQKNAKSSSSQERAQKQRNALHSQRERVLALRSHN